jgi:hypothetical protein
VTSAYDSAHTGAVSDNHTADATPPATPPLLQLPTGLITDILPLSAPSAGTMQGSPDPTTQAANIAPSPGPRDVQHAPATVHTQAGGRAVEKVSPPGAKSQLRELADPQNTTGTVAPAVPHWTPAKVIQASELACIVVLAVLAMMLLARRGRGSSVSRNTGTVVLGENNQLGEPKRETDDGGYAEGYADASSGVAPRPAD